jgi:hypothetical protein
MPRKRTFVNPLLEDTVRSKAHSELLIAWGKAPTKVRDEWYEFGKRNKLSYSEQLGGMDEKYYKRIARILKKFRLYDYRKSLNDLLKKATKQDKSEEKDYYTLELLMHADKYNKTPGEEPN